MPLPLSRKEKLIRALMKHKKGRLIELHKKKHPEDSDLYRKSKREIAIAYAQAAWWPQEDFPVKY